MGPSNCSLMACFRCSLGSLVVMLTITSSGKALESGTGLNVKQAGDKIFFWGTESQAST